MKFFNILLFALICFSVVHSLRRKTQFDEEFDVWIRINSVDSGNEEYQAKAKRVDVMDPAKAKPLGLYFYGLKSVSKDMAKALVKEGSDFYLPYRIVTGDWRATQADTTSRDFIQTTIKIGGESYTFKLKVKYYTFYNNPVSYNELIEYANILSVKSRRARGSVNELIKNLESVAGDYALQMENIEASKKGVEGLNGKMKDYEAQYKTVFSDQDAKRTQNKQIQEQIEKALKELSDLRLKEETLTSGLKNNEETMKSLNTTITDLNKSIGSKSTDSKQFENKANEDKKIFGEKSKELETKAPELLAPKYIKDATESFNKKDIKGVKESLIKVLA